MELQLSPFINNRTELRTVHLSSEGAGVILTMAESKMHDFSAEVSIQPFTTIFNQNGLTFVQFCHHSPTIELYLSSTAGWSLISTMPMTQDKPIILL